MPEHNIKLDTTVLMIYDVILIAISKNKIIFNIIFKIFNINIKYNK